MRWLSAAYSRVNVSETDMVDNRLMRFQKAEQIFDLAMWMQRRSNGVSLADIKGRFGVGHRTAQRMRDAVERIFQDLQEVQSDTREKRWRLNSGRLDRLIDLTARDLAALDVAESKLAKEGLKDDSELLRKLSQKLRTVMKPLDRNRIETDLEFLARSETFVARPGPVLTIADGVYERLKEAILQTKRIRIRFLSRRRERSEPVIEPYGFLFGHRHYLIAINPDKAPKMLKKYSLSGIEQVEVLPEHFIRDETIDLQEHAEKSFGIYVEEEGPVDVVWRFTSEAAPTADEFQFHPKQTKEHQKDGSMLVRFRAAGLVEMAWHLVMWGDQVEVLEPETLRKVVIPIRTIWPTLP